MRQLLTESVLLSGAGALLGVLVAYGSVRGLLALGASKLPRLDAVTFDGRVLLFALVALVVSGLLVGFAPAIRLAGTDARTLMNESSRSSSGGRGTARWLSVMTVAEIALAIMLVAGAGWLVRGFANLRSTDLGFAPEKKLVFDVTFQGPKYPSPDAVRTASNDLMDRLRAMSSVTGVGATSNFPLRNTTENSLLAAFSRRKRRPGTPDGHASAVRQPRLFRGDGHEDGYRGVISDPTIERARRPSPSSTARS